MRKILHIGKTIISCENDGFVAECEVNVVEPDIYSAGINLSDLDIDISCESINGDMVIISFQDIVPDKRVQTHFELNLYDEEARKYLRTVVQNDFKGPYLFKHRDVYEARGKQIYVDGEVVIDGQIIRFEKRKYKV